MSSEEEQRSEQGPRSRVFAISTVVGQERTVAHLLAMRAKTNNLPIYAIIVPEVLKGFIFVEAPGPHVVEEAVAGIKHVKSQRFGPWRGLVTGPISYSELEQMLITKPVIEDLEVSDIVEIVSGPFKGMRAKITRVDRAKQEVTLELLEATFTMTLTVHADSVKLVQRGEREE